VKETGSYRKLWNRQQTEFRGVLLSFNQHSRAIQMFLSQHAMLHSAKLAQSEPWSFEDELFSDLSEEQTRRIPPSFEHSIAWNIWNIARIEDVAMNMLVAGSPQILHRGNWLERMKIDVRDTGNLMVPENVAKLSATIDVEALRAYRLTIGRRTRHIVQQLQPQALKLKVEPSRLQKVVQEGAVVAAAGDLIDYWSKRSIAGLLLIPATRHNFVHLNESLSIKSRGTATRR
jgi:hypothetical protein